MDTQGTDDFGDDFGLLHPFRICIFGIIIGVNERICPFLRDVIKHIVDIREPVRLNKDLFDFVFSKYSNFSNLPNFSASFRNAAERFGIF